MERVRKNRGSERDVKENRQDDINMYVTMIDS